MKSLEFRHASLFLIFFAFAVSFVSLLGVSSAQQPPDYGLLVMAHGGNETWNRRIHEAVRATDVEVPVELAFGMANRATLERAIRALEDQGVRRIAVVRLFVSGESFLAQTEYLLGLSDEIPHLLFDSDRAPGMKPVADPATVPSIAHESEIVITDDGLVDAGLAGEILAERALGLSKSPEHETVVILAHGMGADDSNARLVATLEARAETVRRAAAFRQVAVLTLREDWKQERAAAEARIRTAVEEASEEGTAIVLPFRVAGFGPYAEVLDGLEYVADGTGLLPHRAITAWIVDSGGRIACSRGWQTTVC